jgi:hypothetical protein
VIRARATLPLLVVLFHTPAAHGQDAKKDPPTLIIAGGGMNTDGADLFDQVRRLFKTDQQNYQRTHVTFRGNEARIEGRSPLGAALDNPGALKGSGLHVARLAAQTGHAVLELDMDLSGFEDLIFKGGRGTLLLARQTFRPGPDAELDQALDRVRTKWNRETERAAVFIEQAAREFKRQHPDGKVVVLGHSAFTNAINLAPPTDSQTGQRLIDLRVMSSNRMGTIKHHDPAHTVFVRHDDDLPLSSMGNIFSPDNRLPHDLSKEGVILQIKNKVNYFPSRDGITAKEATRWWNRDPLSAHHQTYEYDQTFDMKVRLPGASDGFDLRGRPRDILRGLAEESRHPDHHFREKFVESLKKQTHDESRVGGVTLTKPAELDLDPRSVRALGVRDGRLVLELHTGETLALPGSLHDEICAAAAACVLRDRPPELSLMPFTDSDNKPWNAVGYIGEHLTFTRLGDLMFEADRVLADIAWGQANKAARPRGIPGYKPYAELALDNRTFHDGKTGGRVWVVPAVVRASADPAARRLVVGECVMAVRFEFYPLDKELEYFQKNAPVGFRDPAGEYLAAQLTAHYSTLEKEFSILGELRETAGYVGVLIWVKRNGIAPTPAAADWIRQHHRRDSGRRAYGDPKRQIKTVEGKSYEVVPVEELREVKEGDVARPAVVFNQHGISRLLWEDGTESRIDYADSGRIERLVSRSGGVSRLVYDGRGRLVALADEHGEGIALLSREDLTVACYWSRIDPEQLTFSPGDPARLIPLADPSGFMQVWLRNWLAAEATATSPAHYRHALKNLGTTYSWLRWSHRPVELLVALAAAVLFVGFLQLRFASRPAELFRRWRHPGTWLLFLVWTAVTLGLLLVLEEVPASRELGGTSWVGWRLIPFVVVPLAAVLVSPPKEGREWGVHQFVGVGVVLGLVVAGLVGLPADWAAFRPALVFAAGVLAVSWLFHLYQTFYVLTPRAVPKLSLFFVLLSLGVLAWTRPDWSDLCRLGAGETAVVPLAAGLEHFSQTSAVSLLPLVRDADPGPAQPAAGLLGVVLVLALLAVPVDWYVEWRVRRTQDAVAVVTPPTPAAS